MAVALDAVVIPLGKSQVSVLTIFTGIVVVLAHLVVTLWISGLIEHRLALATQLDANLRVVLSKVDQRRADRRRHPDRAAGRSASTSRC